MRIGILAPSIYMSIKRRGKMIFAPRELAIELVDGLVRRGHEVYFFTAPDVPTLATLVPGDSFLLEEKASIADVRKKLSPRELWGGFYANKRNYELDLTWKAYLFAREGKIEIVHSFHENLAHFFDGLVDVPTVYTLHDPLPSKKIISYWLLKTFCDHNYISISQSLPKNSDLSLNFVGNVYHGIDSSDYGYFGEKGKYLAFMGRMVPQKGPDDAINIAKRLKIPLKIASSTVLQNMDISFFEEKIKPFIDERNVVFQNFLEEKEKVDFLGKALALIFPIKWEEPFGLVMIEAMACGTPVIAFARGSVPEIISDGETGFIVNQSEEEKRGEWIVKNTGVEGLCEAAERIYSMPKERYREMRRACRAHVEKNFTVEKMVSGYEKVYQRILNLS